MSAPDGLPPDWRDLDASGSYDAAIAELRRRYVAGEPVHELPMFQPRRTVAALYVETGGCYFGLPGVDPWDEARDARLYEGPWPVVAHPPCARWSRMHGFVEHVYPGRFKLGDDNGCFSAALSAVRRFGGVLEHPEGSHAWRAFGLNHPVRSGWVNADFDGGWTCCIDQASYGHRARKATWLYAYGAELPSLKWGRAPGEFPWTSFLEFNSDEGRRRAIRTGICQRLSKRQRAATPIEFRDLLISIARTASPATARRPAGGDKPAPLHPANDGPMAGGDDLIAAPLAPIS